MFIFNELEKMGCNSSTTIKIIEPNKKPINKKNRPPTPGN